MKKSFHLHFWLAGAVFAAGLLARGGTLDDLRGDRVGWARLNTHSEHWMRHASGDPVLMKFIRAQTTLNIDPTWYVADVESLTEMCKYPLLFSQEVNHVQTTSGRANVAEYVRRGGFLLIDACCAVNSDFDEFLRQQKEFLAMTLPEAQVVALPSNHEIYRCFFKIPDGRPPFTYNNNVYDAKKARHGLYGIMIGKHMAGLISLSGLQCGWDKMVAPPGHDIACMQMLSNIYIYAMTHPGL